MNSEPRTDADKLLYNILMNDYIHNYEHNQTYEYMMIIEFDPEPEKEEEDESYRKAFGRQKYIKIHLIMFKTLEIITYQMDLNTPGNVLKNIEYNTNLQCIECRSKCRLKNSMVFCESCYGPDSLHYWELV